jgi:EAL domain-containing protein (putative c-di-GMP-specific phosphodiesterase class I)/CheY-like chemotaxis protein
MDRFKKLSVLIVDDDHFIQTLLTHQLSKLGVTEVYNCRKASSALELISTYLSELNLIICDLQMPEMDGVKFLRELIAMKFLGGIALVSGEDIRVLKSAETFAKANKLFVLSALLKPIEIDSLIAILQGCVEGNNSHYESDVRLIHSREDLEKAIHKFELANYYQPKVELASGKVVGLEILVRWNHPQHGLISPEKFIPLVEDEGLIDHMTLKVLETALSDLGDWIKQFSETHLALNVSTSTMNNLDFPDEISELLHKYSFPASNLTIEVTESEMLQNPEKVFDVLTRLRLKGISLSIDDFGTGYSTLAQLRDVPFSELKIDQGFINGAYLDSSLRAIVEVSLDIAKKIGLTSVAEGVETEEDWAMISQLDCDYVQGFFIGKPMLPESLLDWANGWGQRFKDLVPA